MPLFPAGDPTALIRNRSLRQAAAKLEHWLVIANGAAPTRSEQEALAALLAALPGFDPWNEPEMAPFARQRELIEMMALDIGDAHATPSVSTMSGGVSP